VIADLLDPALSAHRLVWPQSALNRLLFPPPIACYIFADMAKKSASGYDESKIKTLSSLEHIRLRTGMYIGRLGDGSNPTMAYTSSSRK